MGKAKFQILILLILVGALTYLVYGEKIDKMASWPEAVNSGSLLAVKLHLLLGADVNAVKPGRKTPLEEAFSLQPDPAIINELLKHKIDRAKFVDKNKSLMIKAVSRMHFGKVPVNTRIDILKKLMELGEDVNGSEMNSTPLFTAIRDGQPEIVTCLLDSGADPLLVIPHQFAGFEETIYGPLGSCKNSEIFKILLDRGVELDSAKLLEAAIFGKNIEAIKLLAGRGVNLNTPHSKNRSIPLMMVAFSFPEEQVKEFVELGADINSTDEFGRNVLATCIQYDKPELAKYFIEKGTRVNHVDKFGWSLLDFFIDHQEKLKDFGDLEKRMNFLKIFLDNGLDINFQNPENGQTAAMRAMFHQNGDPWALLLMAISKSDKNLQDKNGKTALIHAVEKNKVKHVRMLLLSKADTSIKDNSGMTALDYALEMNAPQLIDMLKNGVKENE